jgi:hypothetical protein
MRFSKAGFVEVPIPMATPKRLFQHMLAKSGSARDKLDTVFVEGIGAKEAGTPMMFDILGVLAFRAPRALVFCEHHCSDCAKRASR